MATDGPRRTYDTLLTAEGLKAFRDRWLGRGWVELFPGSRGMRDTTHGVEVDVLLTGDYPGDEEPKPIRFPDPSEIAGEGRPGTPVVPLSPFWNSNLPAA
jgi:hypothetical protein